MTGQAMLRFALIAGVILLASPVLADDRMQSINDSIAICFAALVPGPVIQIDGNQSQTYQFKTDFAPLCEELWRRRRKEHDLEIIKRALNEP